MGFSWCKQFENNTTGVYIPDDFLTNPCTAGEMRTARLMQPPAATKLLRRVVSHHASDCDDVAGIAVRIGIE